MLKRPLKISPSTLARAKSCPASVHLQSVVHAPDEAPKFHTVEGSVAHKVGEMQLKGIDVPDVITEQGFDITVSSEMLSAVAVYINYIDDLKFDFNCDVEGVEKKLKLITNEIPLMHGKFIIDYFLVDVENRHLEIIDYKHGQGIYVDVRDNEQCLAYLWALIDHLTQLEININSDWTVKMTIAQPRISWAEPIRSQQVTFDQIVSWYESTVDFTKKLENGEFHSEFNVGEHCNFCPVKLACPKLSKLSTDVLPHASDGGELSVDLLTADQKQRLILHEKSIIDFIKEVKNSVKAEINQGSDDYNLLKIVEGNSKRQITHDGKELLLTILNEEDVIEEKLQTLTNIESNVKKYYKDKYGVREGKKLSDDFMAKITFKNKGGDLLVSVDDKRKEKISYANMLNDLKESE